MIVVDALASGLLQALQFFWDSLYGLIFGFLISAIAQVIFTPATMHRYLGPNLRGVLSGASFGIIASACSYGAAAAARGFYQRGADVRAIWAFLISSTNMNVAIVILFWSLLGWQFAFAEFFGGIIIIAVVVAGFSILFPGDMLERLRAEHVASAAAPPALVRECPLCGMEGEPDLAVTHDGTTYLACGRKHYERLQAGEQLHAQRSLKDPSTWHEIAATAMNDVGMLRNELVIGYLLAGFAAALVPQAWFAHVLQTVGAVPYAGYVLLLAVGLLLAVASFVCSMGNVPVARFLANAGIPLGANTTFIYGDLLVPPLVAIYFKSFPAPIARAFLLLFVIGAMLAGAIMEFVIGDRMSATSMGSMAWNDRFTLVTNVLAVIAVAAVVIQSRRYDPSHR
jgi:uncharacterized membrane protein YraQ (UPF0718 family)